MAITDGTQFGRVGAFRFWCQKVLPAVYDDSLSYYELLCKVVDYLNQVIELSNEQSDAINAVQETLNEFLSGEIDPYIEDKIDAWFDENEPEIMAAISSLEDAEFIKGYDYAIIRVPFSFKFSFADSGSIQSLIFEADYLPSYTSHISFKPAQTFQGDKFIYYVGSSQNAPSYSSLDDSQISDLESSQDELLSSFGDDALGDAGGFFEDFWSSRKGSLSNWLGAASELFTVIYNLIPWQISIVITLFLVFGVLTFTINIVGTILTKKSR